MRTPGLGHTSSMRLDSKKGVQSLKAILSILHSKLKTHVLIPLEGNNKRDKTRGKERKSDRASLTLNDLKYLILFVTWKLKLAIMIA